MEEDKVEDEDEEKDHKVFVAEEKAAEERGEARTMTRAQTGSAIHQGQRKENQDSFFVSLYPETENSSVLVIGLLDGHGSKGMPCAETTRNLLKGRLGEPGNACLQSYLDKDEAAFTESMTVLFADVQQKLDDLTDDSSSRVNARFSGTTVSIAFVSATHVWTANVGDSDVVLGSSSLLPPSPSASGAAVVARAISVTHQLKIEQEKERILEAGGRVEAQRGRDGVPVDGTLRVWLPDVQTPGLMVSRSIGDAMCHEIGVSAVPDTHFHNVGAGGSKDQVVIAASDGLWEFVSFQEAMDVTRCLVTPERAAQGLAKLALSRQTRQNSDNVTVVVAFLEDMDARRARLESEPGWEGARAAADAIILDAEAAVRKIDKDASNELKGKLEAATAPSAGGNVGGSIIFGEVKQTPKPASAMPPPIQEAPARDKSSSMCAIS